MGDDGIELGEREPSLASDVRRCCEVRLPESLPGVVSPVFEVICRKSVGGAFCDGNPEVATYITARSATTLLHVRQQTHDEENQEKIAATC